MYHITPIARAKFIKKRETPVGEGEQANRGGGKVYP